MLHAKCVQLAVSPVNSICVFPTHGSCLSSTGPNSKDPFILDQIRWAPLYCFILTPFVFVSKDRRHFYYIILVLAALPCAPKAKEKQT